MSAAARMGTAADSSVTLADRARADLAAWSPSDEAQGALRLEYLDLVDRMGPAAVRRDGGPQHLTVSGFVLTSDLRRVLLTFHRKGQFWVQLGGHLEDDDASPSAAALREAQEEGGVEHLRLLRDLPVDVNRHDLPAAFGACRAHWDIGYALVADGAAVPRVSEESEDVAWFDVDRLPEGAVADLPGRLAAVLAALV